MKGMIMVLTRDSVWVISETPPQGHCRQLSLESGLLRGFKLEV